MSLQIHAHYATLLLVLSIRSALVPADYEFQKFSVYPPFSDQEPLKKAASRLAKPLIGDDGRVYTCSEKNFFAFNNNGSIAWTINLNYTCSTSTAPVHGGSRKIYFVAENRVLKVNPFKVGTPESALEEFFGPEPGEIIGLAVSISSSCVIINVRNRDLLLIGCMGKCSGVLALYSINTDIIKGSTGPSSSEDYAPAVDSNGWISLGSLDGFLYSFSPTGSLKKFPKVGRPDFVIQVSPVVDCSGYGVYVSQTEMDGKVGHTIGDYTYISALKPKGGVLFTMLVPATGPTYWSESYSPGQISNKLFQSDLQHFKLDETTLLAFVAASSEF